MANVRNIRTGFTGDLVDKDGVVHKAKQTAGYIRDEAGAVAQNARQHPSATGSALLLVGAAAFLAGYLLGTSSQPAPRSRFW